MCIFYNKAIVKELIKEYKIHDENAALRLHKR